MKMLVNKMFFVLDILQLNNIVVEKQLFALLLLISLWICNILPLSFHMPNSPSLYNYNIYTALNMHAMVSVIHT